MNTKTLSPTEAKAALQSAYEGRAVGTIKTSVRGCEFLECTTKGADKFVGIITLEFYQTQTGRRSFGIIRVFGPRSTLTSAAQNIHYGHITANEAAALITPGMSNPNDTPLRIGGMIVAHCQSSVTPAMSAYLAILEYGRSYLTTKSKRGYRTPGQTYGLVSKLFTRLETSFPAKSPADFAGWTIEGSVTKLTGGLAVTYPSDQIYQFSLKDKPDIKPNTLSHKLKHQPWPDGAGAAGGFNFPEPIPAKPIPVPIVDVGSMFLTPRRRINNQRKTN